jgi:hypothetical protein
VTIAGVIGPLTEQLIVIVAQRQAEIALPLADHARGVLDAPDVHHAAFRFLAVDFFGAFFGLLRAALAGFFARAGASFTVAFFTGGRHSP